MNRTAARALALAGLTALMSACSGEDSGLKINSFTASPMTVTAGERTTLSWDVTADSISITNVRTGMVIAQSAEATGTVMSAALDETTTFTLEAKAGDEAITRNVTVTVTTEGAPVVDSFTATPAEIDVGASSTLSWQTTGATSVSITAGGTSIVTDGAADGEVSVMPIATTTYTLVAKAADGQTSMATTTITVNTENQVPAVQVFTASPNPIAAGASTTLSWTVLYADTIVVTDADSNEVYNGTNGAGMVSVTPAATTTYTLVATNAQGAGTDSVTVTVNGTIGATIDSFLANPTTVILGQASVLSWAASNADRIEITTAAGTTTVSTSLTGMISVLPAATTEYTLTAFNPAGNASFAATVTVNPAAPAILGFGAAPNPAAIGGSTTLSWNVLGADTVRVTRGTTVEYDGAQGTSSIQIPVTTTSTTFMLTASNGEGASTSQVTVYGHQAPSITTFTAGPNPFAGTATITLTWAAVNVQALELFQDGAAVAGFPGVATSTGTVDASGTLDVVLTTHSTFVLRATSQGGQDEATITVFQQVDESEPNDDAATAQVLTTSGAPVVGMVSPAGDEDWYAVTVPAGGWIRAWTDDGAGACPFDTYMTLTSTDGVTRLAFDDDDGVGTCSFLQPGAIDPGAANLPAGTYFVRVRAYSSSVTGTYVLHVEFGGPGCGNSIIEPSEQCDDGNTAAGDGCDAQCTYEPNGTFTAPGAPQLLSLGAIDPASEVITVRVDVAADAYLFAETFTSTAPAGCNADTRMRLYAADGVTQLGEDDADGIGSCSLFDPNTDAFAQLAAGTYWVTVEEDGRNATIASVFLAIEATPVGQCGNRVVEGTEQCDDGNGQAGDGCDATCVIEPAGIYAAPGGPQTFAMMSIDPIGEQDLYRIDVSATAYLRAETFVDSVAGTCDVDTYIRLFDSAGTQLGIDDDGGVGACSLIDPNTDGFARLDPGTYWLQVEEYGNNGLIARYDVVFSSVAADVCGNGVLETALGEACDDGNTTLGDGCSPTCQVEGPTVVDTEPNDDAANAVVITTSGTLGFGSVSPAGDEDWYAVTVPAGGWIRAWTDDGAGACPFDTFLTLTSTDGATLAASDDDDGVGSCSFIRPGTLDRGAANLVAGTYYVRVRAYSATATGNYVLHVEFGAPACGNQVEEVGEQCDDGNTVAGDGCDASCAFEPAFSFTAPGAVQVVDLGSIDPASEVIAIRINVSTDAYLFAETLTSTAPEGCTSDTRMRLYAADGTTQLGEDDADGVNSCSGIYADVDGFAALSAGTYWLTIEEDNRDATVASLFAGLFATPVGQCGNFVVEGTEQCDDGNATAGDGCDATCQIEAVGVYTAPGQPQTFAGQSIDPVGEQDLYRIDVTATTYVRVETFDDATAGTCGIDTVIRLFDNTGTEVGVDDEGGLNSCSLIDPSVDTFARLAPGTYWLQVEDYLNNSLIPNYDVVFSSAPVDVCGNGVTEPLIGENCDDGNTTAGDGCDATCRFEGNLVLETEPNGDATTANASGLSALGSQTVGGVIAAGGDADWWSFVVPAGGGTVDLLTYGTLGSPTVCGGIDTEIWLYDSTGTQLANNDDIGFPNYCSALTNGPLAAGTYYVRVEYYDPFGASSDFAYYMDITLQ